MLVSLQQFFGDVSSKDVDYEELARCTDDFNGAQCKAVCVEAVSYCHLLIYYVQLVSYCYLLTYSFEAVIFVCYLFIVQCDITCLKMV